MIRDPVDIVISRTFRKQEFCAYLGHDCSSDVDYAKHNVERVKKFFNAAMKDKHDLVADMRIWSQKRLPILKKLRLT